MVPPASGLSSRRLATRWRGRWPPPRAQSPDANQHTHASTDRTGGNPSFLRFARIALQRPEEDRSKQIQHIWADAQRQGAAVEVSKRVFLAWGGSSAFSRISSTMCGSAETARFWRTLLTTTFWTRHHGILETPQRGGRGRWPGRNRESPTPRVTEARFFQLRGPPRVLRSFQNMIEDNTTTDGGESEGIDDEPSRRILEPQRRRHGRGVGLFAERK